jgi:hypothetical protein
MKRLIGIVAMSVLALAACKKDKAGDGAGAGSGTAPAGSATTADGSGSAAKPPDPATGSGSAAAGSAAAGSAAAGSAAAGSAAAGSAAAARPASVTDDMVATAERVVATLEKLSSDVVGAGADCKKMADAFTANTDDVKKMKADSDAMKATHDKDEAVKAWFKAQYEQRANEAMMGMLEHAQKNCDKDQGVRDAFSKLELMKKAPAPK